MTDDLGLKECFIYAIITLTCLFGVAGLILCVIEGQWRAFHRKYDREDEEGGA